jgi:hypothetical protein
MEAVTDKGKARHIAAHDSGRGSYEAKAKRPTRRRLPRENPFPEASDRYTRAFRQGISGQNVIEKCLSSGHARSCPHCYCFNKPTSRHHHGSV